MVLHIQIIWCNKVTGVITPLYLSTSADFTDCLIVCVNFNRFHMFILVNVLLLETIVVVNTLRSLSVN